MAGVDKTDVHSLDSILTVYLSLPNAFCTAVVSIRSAKAFIAAAASSAVITPKPDGTNGSIPNLSAISAGVSFFFIYKMILIFLRQKCQSSHTSQ